ncbi:MAG: ABC transporter permease subunit [Hydrogenophaga sp.]|uniref:ABC transporter permease n=1 Tax=Hydrogenophaga sp. TaxID=1904254 RepID=UPI00271799B4|nr:ABC transporter permease subunit [Hydrogenophaga sp.]MDO9568144.1 ABC transporter permease subunit [Hydrogenophaga sp.]
MTAFRLPFATALLLLAGLPLLATAALALAALLDAAAWRALWEDPHWLRALGLTLWTGLASTALAWWVSAALLAQGFVRQSLGRLLRGLPVMLATPHAALAIGLVFLLAPSGWLLRALSPWLTGFEFPPPWPTTQDPWGLGLIAALTAKEIPFLLWTAATQLQRDDLRQRWRSEHALAQTLGYSPQRAFWRVVWPQLSARLWWPLLAVLAYGLTVVDMALVIGPASPPTLAVLAWQWLQDADLAVNAQGAAAGGVLTLTLLGTALLWRGLQRLHRRGGQRLNGRRGAASTPAGAQPPVGLPASYLLLAGLYGAVLLALAVGSIAGVWPFPRVWPETVTWQAWHRVWDSRSTVGTTLGLALASAALALAWSVAWLELAPRRWDTALRPVLYLSLVLPAVLWVVGLYSLALQWRLEGQWLGLLLAHTAMVLPYVLLALSPAYLGFDARYAQLSASLGHGPWHFLWRIKWPLLRRALAASAAVGFAVSVAQYLPTLYIGAGRFSSVTTEAVNLAAGGQRSLTSAYAGLQFVLPVLAFALAAWLGAPRRFKPAHP